MTTLTDTTSFFETLRTSIARWRERGLADLDDRTLADIGIDRSEIASIEWEARGAAERTRLRIADRAW